MRPLRTHACLLLFLLPFAVASDDLTGAAGKALSDAAGKAASTAGGAISKAASDAGAAISAAAADAKHRAEKALVGDQPPSPPPPPTPPPPPPSPPRPPPPLPPPYNHCFAAKKWGTHGENFRGRVATTASGLVCQRWAFQWPHTHLSTPEALPDAGLTDNYCRNPPRIDETTGQPVPGSTTHTGPWCFTADPATRYALCDVCSADAEHQEPVPPAPPPNPTPEWAGPLCFAFSLTIALAVCLYGLWQRCGGENIEQLQELFFGNRQRASSGLAPRRGPAGGAAAAAGLTPAPSPGGGGGGGGWPVAGSGVTALRPLVAAPPAAPGGGRPASAEAAAQEGTFSTLAGLAALRERQNQPPREGPGLSLLSNEASGAARADSARNDMDV